MNKMFASVVLLMAMPCMASPCSNAKNDVLSTIKYGAICVKNISEWGSDATSSYECKQFLAADDRMAACAKNKEEALKARATIPDLDMNAALAIEDMYNEYVTNNGE